MLIDGLRVSRRPLLRLGVGLFFAQSAFNIYGATLPLYLAGLGFDPTLIGLLIGATGVAELVGALGAGPGIDRFGGRTLLLAGTACYVAASLGFVAFTAVPLLVLLRLLQGFGLAAVLPATYSFVPQLAKARAQTVAFASLGASGSVAMAICPPLGIALLQNAGPPTLFFAAAGMAALAAVSAATLPAPAPSRRSLGLTFRRTWLMPLLVAVLSVVQWGVIQAFVPIKASADGSNPGLLFTADAVAVLASRIPAGWSADRYGPFRLALVGVILMTLSPCVLLLPLTDPVLVAAGLLNGTGAGITLPPMLAQLSRRSDEGTRGTGLAFFSVAFAIGIISGASGGGLLYPVLGFHGLLQVGALLCGCGVLALLHDRVTMQTVAPVETSRRYAAPG
ncbi:MAG: MFS transporter [Chloroflexota bacterium]